MIKFRQSIPILPILLFARMASRGLETRGADFPKHTKDADCKKYVIRQQSAVYRPVSQILSRSRPEHCAVPAGISSP